VVVSIVWAALRRPGSAALAVAMAIWLAFSLTDVVTPRGTHLATLTVMVTVEASIVGQHRHDLTAEHPHTMDPA